MSVSVNDKRFTLASRPRCGARSRRERWARRGDRPVAIGSITVRNSIMCTLLGFCNTGASPWQTFKLLESKLVSAA